MPTLLITGANRGLGLEFVRQYAAEGWHVVAGCRSPAKADQLQDLARKYKVQPETLDVTDLKAIAALAAKLKDTPVDLLINNAGIYSGNPAASKGTDQNFGSIDAASWKKVLETNVIPPIMMIETFLPNLLLGKGRKVVNITSKMGSIGEMGTGAIAYRTSKAALNAAMHNIAPDLMEHRIAIVNLHPGWVKTDMGGADAPVDPAASIAGMRKVIAGLSPAQSGQFLDYQGKTVAW